ncbi:MAG: DNA polymerase III subunit beta [Patescibacteria group bacterium]|nr:DNA polymerase III subunit beta [Patescibacteria group bacterium]
MKFMCSKKSLETGVMTASKAISPRSPLPILGHVLITSDKEGNIKFTGTDLELWIESTVSGEVLREGSITAPAKVMSEIVTQLAEQDTVVEFKEEGQIIEIRNPSSKYSLHTFPYEDFPLLPQMDEKNCVELPQKVLKNMIKNVTFAAATAEETRPVLRGVLFIVKNDTLIMVSTDGRRLAKIERKLEENLEIEEKVIISSRTFDEVERLLKETDDKVKIGFSEGQVFFIVDKTLIISRLIEGQFPNYEQVIPKAFQINFKTDKEQLTRSLRRALIMAQEKDSPKLVKVTVGKDKMIITSNTQDLGKAYEEVDGVVEGEPLTIAFNGKYVMDVLSVLSSKEVIVEFIHPTSPALIRGSEESNYIYVIMPVKIREESPVGVEA